MKFAGFDPTVYREGLNAGWCPARPDQTHCQDWWDTADHPCCACGTNDTLTPLKSSTSSTTKRSRKHA